MEEVECKACHRIDFVGRTFCVDCHWQIRPRELEGPVYGYEVLIAARVTHGLLTEPVKLHFKGSESRCRASAKRHRRFSGILEMWPVGEITYLRAYGDPTVRM